MKNCANCGVQLSGGSIHGQVQRCRKCYFSSLKCGNDAWKELGERRPDEPLPKFRLTREDVFARRQGWMTK